MFWAVQHAEAKGDLWLTEHDDETHDGRQRRCSLSFTKCIRHKVSIILVACQGVTCHQDKRWTSESSIYDDADVGCEAVELSV